MPQIIALAVVAFAHGDKLDKTYLPPSHAQSSGGSNFLQAPNSAPQFRDANNFARNNGFAPSGNGFAPSGNGFAPSGNGFAPSGNGFAPSGNGFAPRDNGVAQSRNVYAQQGNDYAQNGNDLAQNGNGDYNVNFENRPERAQAAFERNAAILRQDNSNDGETYSFAYETENGIAAEENGVATNGVEAQGGYSYTGDDGQVYSIRYTAGQNGFVPEGDHLPTPPPIPEEILKALEQNARDEAAGIYDDGSYKEGSYANGAGAEDYNNYNGNGIQNQYQQNDFGSSSSSDDSVVVNSALLRGGLRNQDSAVSGNGFRQDSSRSGSAVNKEYLPPARSNGFGNRNRQPTFNDRDGYRF